MTSVKAFYDPSLAETVLSLLLLLLMTPLLAIPTQPVQRRLFQLPSTAISVLIVH